MFSSMRFANHATSWVKAGVSLATAGILVHNSSANCQSSSPDKRELVAVYLKPESKVLVEKFLATRGYKEHTVDYVAIHSNAKESSSFVFRPLFGERAAFRLKGLLTLENGEVVGIGRVSNMVGELYDEERIIAMPVLKKDSNRTDRTDHVTPALQSLLDAPTRLFSLHPDVMNKPLWKGRIPSGKIDKDGVEYPAVKATYVSLPTSQQVIVEGYLCSNTHFCNSTGKCTYDRSLEVEQSVLVNETEVKQAEESHSKQEEIAAPDNSSADGEVDKKECPVCRYMKNGPCKNEFLAWDACMTSLTEAQELHDCFPQTKKMMFCMRDYEYYDIMSAGTDFSKLEAADQAGKALAETNGAVKENEKKSNE